MSESHRNPGLRLAALNPFKTGPRRAMTQRTSTLHRVHIRSNEGLDTFEDVLDFDIARDIIRQAKCAANIMVRLQIGERLVLRWDRILSARENRWRSMDVGAVLPPGFTPAEAL